MDTLWTRGPSSVRELLEAFPEPGRSSPLTTVQTVVYRLEAKKAIRRIARVSNAHVFEAIVSRSAAPPDRRPGGVVRRQTPAYRNAPDRIGKAHARGGARGSQGAAKSVEESEVSMIPGPLQFGESPVAIHSVCGNGGSSGAGLKTKSGAGPILSLARRVSKVLHSLFSSGNSGQLFCATPRRTPPHRWFLPLWSGSPSPSWSLLFPRGRPHQHGPPQTCFRRSAMPYGRWVLRLWLCPCGGDGGKFGARCSGQRPYVCSTGFRSCLLRRSSNLASSEFGGRSC